MPLPGAAEHRDRRSDRFRLSGRFGSDSSDFGPWLFSTPFGMARPWAEPSEPENGVSEARRLLTARRLGRSQSLRASWRPGSQCAGALMLPAVPAPTRSREDRL